MQNQVRILSWNVLISNKRLEEALNFLKASNADIICLQEVSNEFLGMLRSLTEYSLISGIDTIFVTNSWRPRAGETRVNLVILSKFPLDGYASFKYEELPLQKKVRTEIFHLALYMTGVWIGGRNRDRSVLSADIRVDNRKVRVFSVHLSLHTPQIRETEFGVVRQNLLSDGINIVAGDLNILEAPWIKVWNWLQGGRIQDSLPWVSEREKMERKFKESGLSNHLIGKVTCPISGSQLDHILVPEDLSVSGVSVFKNRYGSDHNPIFLDLKI